MAFNRKYARSSSGKRKTWALSRLVKTCRVAAIVYLALADFGKERGSHVVPVSRAALAEATGIGRLQSLSDALTALERAGWIDREHVPVFTGGHQTATLLRVVLRRERFLFPTKRRAVENEKRCQGSSRKAFLDSSKEEECADVAAHGGAAAPYQSASKAQKNDPASKSGFLDAQGAVMAVPPRKVDGVPICIAVAQSRMKGEAV